MDNALVVFKQENTAFLSGWYAEFLKDFGGNSKIVIIDLCGYGMSLEGLSHLYKYGLVKVG